MCILQQFECEIDLHPVGNPAVYQEWQFLTVRFAIHKDGLDPEGYPRSH